LQAHEPFTKLLQGDSHWESEVHPKRHWALRHEPTNRQKRRARRGVTRIFNRGREEEAKRRESECFFDANHE